LIRVQLSFLSVVLLFPRRPVAIVSFVVPTVECLNVDLSLFVTFVGLYTIKPVFYFTVVTFVPVMLYSLKIVMF
jgi:hypothetical protein